MGRTKSDNPAKSKIPLDARCIYDLCAVFAVVAIDMISIDIDITPEEQADIMHIKSLAAVWFSNQGRLSDGATIVHALDEIVSALVDDKDAMEKIMPYTPSGFKNRKIGEIFDNSGAFYLAQFCNLACDMNEKDMPALTLPTPQSNLAPLQ